MDAVGATRESVICYKIIADIAAVCCQNIADIPLLIALFSAVSHAVNAAVIEAIRH
jgi:hypothetical protein